MSKHRAAAIVLLWTALAAPAHGETFLILVEELRNGEPVELPLSSQEGLMSAMFDLGHITFETGLYRPALNWDGLEFSEPLLLAREGGAGYLAVVRVFAQIRRRDGGVADGAAEARAQGVEIESRAEYVLFDASISRLLGRGELLATSTAGECELTYEQLLFQTGETLARELAALCPARGSR